MIGHDDLVRRLERHCSVGTLGSLGHLRLAKDNVLVGVAAG